ncbi:MAG TPA: GNAT family N-acetyltransferase [Candidatus Angelobacter sp.]|nr:GNAT family N-acetyltransferase [Candidatus Angelobacter sp.]
MAVQPFTIRRATPADAAGILACLQAAFQPYQSRYTPLAYADTVLTAETLHRRLEFMSIFIAASESAEVIGTIGCNPAGNGEGHLRGMAVLSAWQGAGVAEALLKSAESELHSLGCERVTLDTTQPLERAIRFYEKHGYRPTGKVADFFDMSLYEYAKPLR